MKVSNSTCTQQRLWLWAVLPNDRCQRGNFCNVYIGGRCFTTEGMKKGFLLGIGHT